MIESLIPAKYKENATDYVRARTLAYGIVIVFCINLFHELLGIYQQIPILVDINKITIVVAVVTFFLFRAGISMNVCMAILFLDCLGLIGFFSTAGGGIESQILSWLGVLCSGVLLVSTELIAILCFSASLLVILIFFVLEIRGEEFETISQLKGNKSVFGLGQALLTTTSFLVTYVFFKNKNEAYNNLEIKKEELAESIVTLRKTQQQLVQQEKLASLGSLTNGIAHEILNPLNFVNNFSDLVGENTQELISLTEKLEKKYPGDEILIELSEEIKFLVQYSEKIHEHGGRAERIVRAMLLHTQFGKQTRNSVDLNKLITTLAAISLKSFKTINSDFDCKLVIHADNKIESVNIVQQDITHALGNILSNSFYATREKRKNSENFNPEISLTTTLTPGNILIRIRDNGNGIAENIRKKIFEPFFTTKPTGEGTGLGLSICYDIIKSQGGDLQVESIENEFSEFVISLPVETEFITSS